MAESVKAVGSGLVNPCVYFNPTAQQISRIPATRRSSQAIPPLSWGIVFYWTVQVPSCCQCVRKPLLSKVLTYARLAAPERSRVEGYGQLIVTLFPALLRVMPLPDTVQRPFVNVPVLLPGVMNPGMRSVPALLMSTTWLPVGKNTIWQGVAADDLSADQQMDHAERSDAAGMAGCDRVCGG